MSAIDTAILMPFASGAAGTYATPFGEVCLEWRGASEGRVAVLARGDDPRAAPWAAKALGARRLAAVASSAALNRLLRPCDWLVPDDYVDQTRGGPATYFTERGLGYVQQRPPFCPDVRAALAGLPESREARVFECGTLVAAPRRTETPAEARWWQRLGGDVAGYGLFPALALARELELCVAAVCYVTRDAGGEDETWIGPADADAITAALIAGLPATFACNCNDGMAAARQRAGLDDNWWKTIGS